LSKERAAQLVDAGIWLRLSGDVEGARRLFEQALKLDPQSQRAVELLAQEPTKVIEPTMAKPSSREENPFEWAPWRHRFPFHRALCPAPAQRASTTTGAL